MEAAARIKSISALVYFHYANRMPNAFALYYAQNYAGIIRQGLLLLHSMATTPLTLILENS